MRRRVDDRPSVAPAVFPAGEPVHLPVPVPPARGDVRRAPGARAHRRRRRAGAGATANGRARARNSSRRRATVRSRRWRRGAGVPIRGRSRSSGSHADGARQPRACDARRVLARDARPRERSPRSSTDPPRFAAALAAQPRRTRSRRSRRRDGSACPPPCGRSRRIGCRASSPNWLDAVELGRPPFEVTGVEQRRAARDRAARRSRCASIASTASPTAVSRSSTTSPATCPRSRAGRRPPRGDAARAVHARVARDAIPTFRCAPRSWRKVKRGDSKAIGLYADDGRALRRAAAERSAGSRSSTGRRWRRAGAT